MQQLKHYLHYKSFFQIMNTKLINLFHKKFASRAKKVILDDRHIPKETPKKVVPSENNFDKFLEVLSAYHKVFRHNRLSLITMLVDDRKMAHLSNFTIIS